MATKLKEAIAAEVIKFFMIDKSLYAVSGVEKIIPKEEAYIVFPEANDYLQRMETKQPSFTIKLNENNNQKSLNS